MGFAATMKLFPFFEFNATLNQQRPVPRPQIQNPVHMLCCRHKICSPLLDPLHSLEQRPVLRPQTQDPLHMHGCHHVVDNYTKASCFIATSTSKAKPKKFEKKGGAIVKVEGGHVEGGVGSQAGGRARGQAGNRVARVGRLGQGRAMPGSGDRGSGFFGVAPARCSDTCNSGRGFLESPAIPWPLV
jgi:hypothetical protein